MATTRNKSLKGDRMDDSLDLNSAELEMVTANEQAGLISQLACHFCGREFDIKKTRTLRAHIEEVHVLGDCGYMCGLCCEEFSSRKAVEAHMSTFHRTPSPLGCGVCGETFRIRNMLLKHLDSHIQAEIDNNKVGLCYCGECFEFFDSVAALHTHTMIHREQAIYVCGACGLQTQHRHIMIKHLECHVISNLLTANGNLADASFVNLPLAHIDSSCVQDAVTKSQRVEEEENETAEDMKNKVNQSDEDTNYKCGVCCASFSNLAEALGHAESHQEEEFSLLFEDSPENADLSEDIAAVGEAPASQAQFDEHFICL
ncbi:zinc finger protein 416 [Elysia marginata]|uniref:Zinc finger protein 416 n=1 Tax=Elysia marginata TaxID=1093978 RepID=A0AAV4J4G2_9GAST|nr:zinc finger protein 416 [Elysia marginata]